MRLSSLPDLLHYRLHALITQAWQRKGLFSLIFWPLSKLTASYLWVNHKLYLHGFKKRVKLSKPVIVVGNVTVGGAGKTPVVIELVKYLTSTGRSVGVISRGYGASRGRGGTAGASSVPLAKKGATNTNDLSLNTDSDSKFNPTHEFQSAMNLSGTTEVTQHVSAQVCGDEPKLIHAKTGVPVFVGTQRAEAARLLILKYPEIDVLISDDGLQHQQLARDLNVIIFDDTGLGNGFLLPAGPLRENWPIQYPNAKEEFVLSTNNAKAPIGFKVKRALSDFAYNREGQKLDLRVPTHKRIHALAGIARPYLFFRMLEERGLQLSQTTALQDHANLNEEQLSMIFKSSAVSSAEETLFLCTEKDAIKIWEFSDCVWAVPLDCTLETQFIDIFEDWLVGAGV